MASNNAQSVRTYLLLLTHSAESAASVVVSGSEGAAQQREQLEQLGLTVLGQWLVLGRSDVALIVEGPADAVFAFSTLAQHARQTVEVLPLVDPAVTTEVQSRLARLATSEPSPE